MNEPGRRIHLLDQGKVRSLARAFTVAEKALIQKLHGYMPAASLLAILNERLQADLGHEPGAQAFTIEQLYAEIGGAQNAAPEGGHDWAGLRKLLARARRDGLLDTITETVIDDFAVVFGLNTRQVVQLKDIVLRAKEAK